MEAVKGMKYEELKEVLIGYRDVWKLVREVDVFVVSAGDANYVLKDRKAFEWANEDLVEFNGEFGVGGSFREYREACVVVPIELLGERAIEAHEAYQAG